MKNKVITLTDDNFNHQVIESVLPVLVLFCTCWSGSSDIIKPMIEELAQEFSGKVAFAKIDADKHSEIAMTFSVDSIPSLLFFNHGRVVDQVTGVISKSELAEKLKALVR